MYNKTSFINETDYAEVSGTRWIMRDLPNYAEGHQLCARIIAQFNDPYSLLNLFNKSPMLWFKISQISHM